MMAWKLQFAKQKIKSKTEYDGRNFVWLAKTDIIDGSFFAEYILNWRLRNAIEYC